MKRARQWVIGAIFSCTECEQEWQNYKTAQREAARHARLTGHRVTGEVTRAVEYGATGPRGTND